MNFFDCIIVFSVYSNFKKEPNLQTIDKIMAKNYGHIPGVVQF